MHEMHFIASHFYYSLVLVDEIGLKRGIKKAFKKFRCTSAILSQIFMQKLNCITKERYQEMYKTNEEIDTRIDLSVGEDLETFIGRIKNGEINKDRIPGDGELKDTFLLCLLDKNERKKLEQKDEDFMETFYEHIWEKEADVPEAEWEASESNMKFTRSECRRYTYIID